MANALGKLIQEGVELGIKKLGGKTAEKIVPAAKVVKPRAGKTINKATNPKTPAVVTDTNKVATTTKNPSRVRYQEQDVTPSKAASSTKGNATRRTKAVAKATPVVAKRRIKDIAGATAVAGTAGYLGGKNN